MAYGESSLAKGGKYHNILNRADFLKVHFHLTILPWCSGYVCIVMTTTKYGN
jgi:hypothetical protein